MYMNLLPIILYSVSVNDALIGDSFAEVGQLNDCMKCGSFLKPNMASKTMPNMASAYPSTD